jgi:hypothetical protein
MKKTQSYDITATSHKTQSSCDGLKASGRIEMDVHRCKIKSTSVFL